MLQLFAFQDRKENKYLLAPTHEEEITSLVASSVQSYKDLPLRLYQTCKSQHLALHCALSSLIAQQKPGNTEMKQGLGKDYYAVESSS